MMRSWLQTIILRNVPEFLQFVGLHRPLKRIIRYLIEFRIPRVIPTIIRVLPHDPKAFTQGLAYHDGRLFESTGPIESSSLRELSLTDGSTLRYVPVPGHHAEGLAVLNNTLYQLTWTSQKAFLYDVYTLERQDERAYEGEGWGLCMGNNSLLMSNGTSEIVFRNAGFKATARIHVRSHGIPVRHINDIQQVGKFVYVNVLNIPSIYVISLESGQLVGIVDCVRLLDQEEPNLTVPVLNGIAHCMERSTLFITGKYLPRLYEIALPSWR